MFKDRLRATRISRGYTLQKTADELDSCRMIAESITSLGKGRLVDRTVREGRRGPASRIHRFSHRTVCAVTLRTVIQQML